MLQRALHAEVLGAPDRSSGPSEPPARRVVLVHGFTQTGRSWMPIASALAAEREVLAVDAPGHGSSGALRGDLVETARLAGAAGGRATYVGYSMGARIVLHLALDRPDLVEGLVLLGVTPGIEDESERAARRAADEARAEDIERDGVDAFLATWLSSPLFARLPAEAAALEDRRRNPPAGLAASLRECGTGTQTPLWNRLGKLRMPVLVLAGAHDDKFVAIGRRTAEAIGANATFALVPGAGHPAHLEQPAAFLALLQPWLAAH